MKAHFNTSPRRPSDPRAVVIISMFCVILVILLCSILPFVWQAWRP